jgi:uncharacterized iron-regulated protein
MTDECKENMIKKCLSFALCCLVLIAANSSFISAQTNAVNNASSIARIKADVAKHDIYERKLVVVKKLDGTKLKGYITQKGDDSFSLTESKTNQSTIIAYIDVAQVKRRGLSITEKIAIGAVTGAAAIVLTIVLIPICNEGKC